MFFSILRCSESSCTFTLIYWLLFFVCVCVVVITSFFFFSFSMACSSQWSIHLALNWKRTVEWIFLVLSFIHSLSLYINESHLSFHIYKFLYIVVIDIEDIRHWHVWWFVCTRFCSNNNNIEWAVCFWIVLWFHRVVVALSG